MSDAGAGAPGTDSVRILTDVLRSAVICVTPIFGCAGHVYGDDPYGNPPVLSDRRGNGVRHRVQLDGDLGDERVGDSHVARRFLVGDRLRRRHGCVLNHRDIERWDVDRGDADIDGRGDQ